MAPSKTTILGSAVLLGLANGHSWLECADYRGTTEGFKFGDYNVEDCNGFPRPLDGGRRGVGRQAFGQDIGMDKQATRSNNSAQCHTGPVADSAYGNFPKAVYAAGSTYTLAWPAKNHAAAACTNANIPDGGLKVFAAKVKDNGQDPNFDEFQETQVPGTFSSDPHVNGQIDMKGFQNCEDFCANTDKAFCHGEMTIPANMEAGKYTFQWYWEFNTGQIYVSCFDVEVTAATQNTPTPNPSAAPTPAPTNGGNNATPAPTNGGNNATPAPTNGNNPTPRPTVNIDGISPFAPNNGECAVSPGTNSINVMYAPNAVHANIENFTVRLCYSATARVALIVELIDIFTGEKLGFGVAAVSSEDSGNSLRTVLINVNKDMTPGIAMLKVFNVEYSTYLKWIQNEKQNDMSNYELSRREYSVRIKEARKSDGATLSIIGGITLMIFAAFL